MSSLIVSSPHDDWEQFPKASLPILPTVRNSYFFGSSSKHEKVTSAFLRGTPIYTFGGRYALSLAMDYLQINKEANILMPAFHCLSMIAPIAMAGVKLLFYRLEKNLQMDLEDIKRKITSKTKAIIVVHYFGFPQKLEKLAELCRNNGIFLIEDCAHAFFGRNESVPIGTIGDVAITSLKKFFPVSDGGAIICNTVVPKIRNQYSLSIMDQTKLFKHTIENALHWEYQNKFGNLSKRTKNQISSGEGRDTKFLNNKHSNLKKIMDWFDSGKKNKRISRIAKLMFDHADINFICDQRVDNYLYLLRT